MFWGIFEKFVEFFNAILHQLAKNNQNIFVKVSHTCLELMNNVCGGSWVHWIIHQKCKEDSLNKYILTYILRATPILGADTCSMIRSMVNNNDMDSSSQCAE